MRRSLYSDKIKSVNDLLRDKVLVRKFREIFRSENGLARGHWYKFPTAETNDEFIALLIDLEVARYNWNELKKQRHRQAENHLIEFTFDGDKILNIFDRLECRKSFIRRQTLEHIAIKFGEAFTGIEIIKFLKDWGIPESLIEYPSTKWRMVFAVFSYYANSPEREDNQMLLKIIEEIVHPLMYRGDMEKSKQIVDEFNNLLYFDNFELYYSSDEKKYKISYEPTSEDLEEMDKQMWEDECKRQEEQEKINRLFYGNQKNKNAITTLRKTYQVFINIVETFCQNPTAPTHELNDAYLKTHKIIKDILGEFRKCENKPIEIQSLAENLYFPFFSSNLFGVESLFNRRNEKLDWENIRPKMNYSYGEIDDIFRNIKGSDILSEPDIQKTLNDISLFVSETKNKNESLKTKLKEQSVIKRKEILKIEIAEMPELKIKGISEEPKKDATKIKLSDVKIDFKDNDSKIIASKKECKLPPYKNEHFLCRVMFDYEKGEFVDWSSIFDTIDSRKNIDLFEISKQDRNKFKRSIQDAMYAINRRIKRQLGTDNDLFSWRENSMTRNY